MVENQCGASDIIQSIEAKVIDSANTSRPGAATRAIFRVSIASPFWSWSRSDVKSPCAQCGAVSAGRVTGDPGVVPLSDVTDEAYRAITGVNLDGVFYGVRAVLPRMVAHGGGQILVTASMAGLGGMAGDAPYTATKHAVVGLVKSLGASLDAFGVCISAICPGFVDTPLVPPEAQAFISEMGLPVIAPAQVAEAAMQALAARANGSQWIVWGDIVRQHTQPDFGLQ